MYIVSQFISKNTTDKVIFSGEGSDEILEGYLYFKNAPTPKEGEEESVRLINNLHMYDVLRADRCISSNGLEPRVPFLDRKVVNVSLSIPAEEKCPRNGIEKYVLRKAFENGYLPDEVLWRQKEALSDGVSGLNKSWYSCIQEFVEGKISDSEFNKDLYPSKEAQYYRSIFDSLFPGYRPEIPYWLPKWCGDVKDPSARVLKVYNS
jgi:asparagine synthase (glutamine-hydrolysing)